MIPHATTTTITVRTVTEPEPGDARTTTVTATGVRAVISAPSATAAVRPGGGQADHRYRLNCDPVTLTAFDQVVDDTTGTVYEVDWAEQRTGLGIAHTVANLSRLEGQAA